MAFATPLNTVRPLKKPLPIDELLARLSACPMEGAKLLAGLDDDPTASELLAALRGDPRFRAPLRAALGNVEAVDAEAPSLAQLVRGDLDTVPRRSRLDKPRAGSRVGRP